MNAADERAQWSRIPLGGTPGPLTRFPKAPSTGTLETLRRQLRAEIDAVEAPADLGPRQTFPVVGQNLTPRIVRGIANVATSSRPAQQLLKREKRTFEQHVGLVSTAFTILFYEEAKEHYQLALHEAQRMIPREQRESAEVQVRDGFERVTQTLCSALSLAGVEASRADLDRMLGHLHAEDSVYQTIRSMRDSVRNRESASAPSSLTATVVPFRSADTLGRKAILDIEVPFSWCFFEPIEGVRTAHFSKSFSWNVSITYPCGVDWCSAWGIPYPCGVDWCTATVTVAGLSVNLSFDVGYQIDCCGATVWGEGEAETCVTVLDLQVCATCTAKVLGVLGIGMAAVADGQCAYGLGVIASVQCKIQGYLVFSGSVSWGWTLEGICPPLGLCPEVPDQGQKQAIG
jgi:hypothetical protein